MGEVGGGEVVVILVEMYFGGDGDFDGVDYVVDECGGFIEFGYYGGVVVDFDDFFYGVVYVDVDGGGVEFLVDDGGVVYFFGNGVEKLDGERVVGGVGFDEFEGGVVVFDEGVGVDEIGGGLVEFVEFVYG